MLSNIALNEFKEIWRTDVGTAISDSQAVELATKLLTAFDAVYKPIKKEDYEKEELELARN